MHKIKSYTFLILALSLIVLLGAPSCSSDGNKDPENTSNENPLKVVLKNSMDLYLKKSLNEAKIHAKSMKDKTEALCVSGTETSLDPIKNEWKETFKYLKRQEFFDFVESYTVNRTLGHPKGNIRKRLDERPVKAQEVETFLNKSVAEITEASVDSKGTDLVGLHVIEYLLYGTGTKPAKDNSACKLLTITSKFVEQDIEQLSKDWEAFYSNFTDAEKGIYETDKKALDEILEHAHRGIGYIGQFSVARPTAHVYPTGDKGTGVVRPNETEAPYSKNGAWAVNEVITGLWSLYTGKYENTDFTVKLSEVVNNAEPATAEAIKANYKEYQEAIKPFLPPNSLEQAIADGDKTAEIKRLIQALSKLQQNFKVDIRRVLGTGDTGADADND